MPDNGHGHGYGGVLIVIIQYKVLSEYISCIII